jgi:c-di-GMP-binding flagellar brake protein YcgR
MPLLLIPTQQTAMNERRKYFRIQNKILLRIHSINETLSYPPIPITPCKINLLNEIQALALKNETFLHTLNETPSTQQHCQQMKKGFHLLIKNMTETLHFMSFCWINVDLSAGGLRFQSKNVFQQKELVQLELLIPSNKTNQQHHILTIAEVIHSQEVIKLESESINTYEKNKQYEIALKFTQINESDKDLIIRHLFKIQSQTLRIKKN